MSSSASCMERRCSHSYVFKTKVPHIEDEAIKRRFYTRMTATVDAGRRLRLGDGEQSDVA